jgi:hypothetical protein
MNAAFILAFACAEDDSTGEGCPAADRVDDRRACEVEEAELRVEEAAAPLPGSLDRVEVVAQNISWKKKSEPVEA